MFSFLSRKSSTRRSSPALTKAVARATPSVVPETLEDRKLFSASAAFDWGTGVITVNGTDAADTITAYQTANDTWVVANGQTVMQVSTYLTSRVVVNAMGGDDYVSLSVGTIPTTIDGGAGNDTLVGSAGNDTIIGGDGNDFIFGLDGNDALGAQGSNWERGNDTIYGYGGNDYIGGGLGNDTLYGNDGDDVIYGHEDNDLVDGGAGNDYLNGWTGDDVIVGGLGNDSEYGGDGNDVIGARWQNGFWIDDAGNDQIFGGAGVDNIGGGFGNDTIHGDDGDDVIWGDYDNDTLYGDNGNDTLVGYTGDDVIVGGAGNDSEYGGDGNDTIWGEYSMPAANVTGNDFIDGGAGNDTCFGDNGNDTIHGGDGNDALFDYYGNDQVYGDNGDDALYGEFGSDRMDGGAGWDTIDYSNWTHAGKGVTIDLRTTAAVNGAAGEGDSLIGIENATGTNQADVIYGVGGNYIRGLGGDDQIFAGSSGWTNVIEGGDGNDTIVTINGLAVDRISGGAGADVIWADQGDVVTDASAFESARTVKFVGSFANGADRTLNGDNIVDPTDSGATANYRNNPLFSTSGPSWLDVHQRGIGDCWLMSGLGATAHNNPMAIKGMVVSFGDGTYGVALGGKYYRVDADLPGFNAAPGQQGAIWVPIIEKAYASFRSGANTFSSLNSGNPVEVYRAMGDSGVTWWFDANTTNMLNRVASDLRSGRVVTIATKGDLPGGDGAPLVGGHSYMVVSVNCNSAGQPVSITVRNPWGVDGVGNDGNNDGFVTVSAFQAGRNFVEVESAVV